MAASVAIERTKYPVQRGTRVPSYDCPIPYPIAEASRVEIEPISEEAVPAICPCGSMARALKLENTIPTRNMIPASNSMKGINVSSPVRARTAMIAERTVSVATAP
jgi:hypothetical protein